MEEYDKLFVGGDLSGIQKFLYNISSRKAAVSLKGRSYYLKQYMKNICNNLRNALNDVGETKIEVIYCSGGKFYMLTNNSSTVTKCLEEHSKEIKESLWKEHFGQLGINLSWTPFSENSDGTINANGKTNEKPGYLWRLVNADFAKQKNQKFIEILNDSYNTFFEPIPIGGKPKVCAITGIESKDCVKFTFDNDEVFVLPSVKQQIQLGESLRNHQHFKTFEEYADQTDLGILRMDVDGLGKRFIEGFNSIKEYQNFSKHLVEFFEDRIEEIQQEPAFHPYLNIIYAGGDDLFIVGRWDKVIDIAERIHKETLARFSNDGISISGGIAIVRPKFPIAKAAELAGEAEESAKKFRNGEKNAFHMLGKTISWDKEFDYVKSYKDQFVSLINNYSLSKSILHKMMLYSSIADMNKSRRAKGIPEDFSYIWHASYYLTRYIERYKTNSIICSFCKSLKDKELSANNGRNLELIALAARWAELLLKDNIINK